MTTPAFEKFWVYLINVEDPDGKHNVDEGGETVYGISRKWHPDEPWPPTPERAKEIAYHDYWQVLQCDALPPDIAFYLADTSFNQGQGYAVCLFQQLSGVYSDGKMGPNTIDAIHRKDPKTLTGTIHARRSEYYVNRGGLEMDGLLVRLRKLALATYGREGVQA